MNGESTAGDGSARSTDRGEEDGRGVAARDALVLGGGPAGAAAAAVLADAGVAVTLLRPHAPPSGSLAQSIPPSARSLLDELGFLLDVERAGFVRNVGNVVAWAGLDVRTETFAEGEHGHHVDRTTLEVALDAALRGRRVHVLAGCSARSAARTGSRWRVDYADATGGKGTLTAPWVVDATGRHGFLARRLGRATDPRTSTVALFARWASMSTDPYEGQTVIESHADGWAWSVPVTPALRCFTAMIDPRLTALGHESVDRDLDRELAKAPLIAALSRRGVRVQGPAIACPASLYTAQRHTDEGLVLAGDAGSFIDPLSSYGVKKALLSGRLAGIVVATAIEDAAMASHACAYHEAHERRVTWEYRARAATFFEEAATAHGQRFWSDRVAAAHAGASDTGLGGPVSAPLDAAVDVAESEVRRAHQTLRDAPRLTLRPAPALRRVRLPALRGRRIVLDEHLTSHRHPSPVRYYRSVDLRHLTEIAPEHDDVAGLWSAYARDTAPVDLAEFVTALSVACAAGFLETGVV